MPGYSVGPGASYVQKAIPFIPVGSSLIDFGCGTGDAAANFQALGYKVQAVDISKQGLRHDLVFFEAPLSALPAELLPADWGFCCDVMEHLPTEWVGLSLKEMSGKVKNCFFSICLVPDGWGVKIGEVLHLTVMPAAWWMDQIKEYWATVELINESPSVCLLVARND